MKKTNKIFHYAIWIDKRQAMVLKSGEHNATTYKTIASENADRERFAGETTNKTFGIAGFDLPRQRQMQEKLNNRNANFLKAVMAEIKDANSILILGSGDNRHELQNAIEKNKQINGAHLENKAYKKINQRELELIMEEHLSQLKS